MSYPILYREDETNFDHNGLGILSDCVSCKVSESINGEYEMTMEYPVKGIHQSDIKSRSIIKVKPNQTSDYQLFRVYSQKKNMRKNVVVKAEHISYDLIGIPVSPFSANNVLTAISNISSFSVVENPFSFWTDRNDSGDLTLKKPLSARKVLSEIAYSFGGEYEFDNYTVKLHSQRGQNRGVSIRYGKNLTSLKQEENCSAVYTGVYPYWVSQDGRTLVQLDEKVINAPGTYGFVRIKTVDFSSVFEKQPTKEQLRESAEKYIESNHVGIPPVSMDVSFAALDQSSEYKNMALLERIYLGDTVTVEFAEMGVDAQAKAVKMVYNVLLDRVDTVTLGEVRSNIADTIAEQKRQLGQVANKSQLQIAIDALTKALLGANGGSVRMLDENGDGMPDTLYIADDPDPNVAEKVWRFNYQGWGASKTGYAGPYIMGASFDGGILAEFITAGVLYGMTLKAGIIESESGKIRVDLTSDSQPVFNTGISTNGLTVRADEANAKKLMSIGASKQGSFYTAMMSMDSATGGNLLRMAESVIVDSNGDTEPYGFSISINDKEKTARCDMGTAEREANIQLTGKSESGKEKMLYVSNDLIMFRSDGSFNGALYNRDDGVYLDLPGSNKDVKLFLKSNGDGTYTLMGE